MYVHVQSEVSRRYRHHIPAPPKPAPGHAESYNPPPEYLFTEQEVDTEFFIWFVLLNAIFVWCQVFTKFQKVVAEVFRSSKFCQTSSISILEFVGKILERERTRRTKSRFCSTAVFQPSIGAIVSTLRQRTVWTLPWPLPLSPPKKDACKLQFLLVLCQASCGCCFLTFAFIY